MLIVVVKKLKIITLLLVVPYSTVSFWYYVTLDGARLGEVHLSHTTESKLLKMVILVCDDPLRKVSQTTACFPCLPIRIATPSTISTDLGMITSAQHLEANHS